MECCRVSQNVGQKNLLRLTNARWQHHAAFTRGAALVPAILHLSGRGMIVGGDGGEAAQYGRPGLGDPSPLERFGLGDFVLPDGRKLSEFGRGGHGSSPPIQDDPRPTSSAAR
jgi:hypothetical protein